MITLVVVYCLLANSKQCIEQKYIDEEHLRTPMGCLVAGPQQAVEFIKFHPKYKMNSWRCEVNVPKQLPA
jgi:hypothetical protein